MTVLLFIKWLLCVSHEWTRVIFARSNEAAAIVRPLSQTGQIGEVTPCNLQGSLGARRGADPQQCPECLES